MSGISSALRVGEEWRMLEEGKMIIFDDSFEHEAFNASSSPRIVLIFDIWHPDFSNEEVNLSFKLKPNLDNAISLSIDKVSGIY